MVIDKSNQRVRRMFGEIAPKYDRMNHLLSLNVDRYWRWKTTRIVSPAGDLPILDVCSGTGDLALAYLKASRGATRILATDFCRPMLDVAAGKKARRGLDRELTLIAADTQQLPFDDDAFQIVAVAFGLRNVDDTDRGLREMVRVCAVGGRVAVLEFSMPGWQPLKGLYLWYFRYVLPRIGQWLAKNQEEAYNYLPASVHEFPSGAALAERMRQAGLGDVCYHPLTLGIATLYVGTK